MRWKNRQKDQPFDFPIYYYYFISLFCFLTKNKIRKSKIEIETLIEYIKENIQNQESHNKNQCKINVKARIKETIKRKIKSFWLFFFLNSKANKIKGKLQRIKLNQGISIENQNSKITESKVDELSFYCYNCYN